MNLLDLIKEKVFKKRGLKRLPTTPNNDRLTFISDEDAIRVDKIRCNKVWYYGDGNELLNYYTNQNAYGWLSNPIYNRNMRNFFWGISSTETDIKRIHSGVPKAIIDTITNIVGKPKIVCSDPRLEKILEINNFEYRLSQQSRPMTLVEGDGCWKINFNKVLSDVPLLEYIEAEDYTPIYQSSILLGLIFRSYYKDKKGQNYVLIETRMLDDTGCMIEYELYRIGKKNDLSICDFDKIPELRYLKDNSRMHIGVRKLFAVPSKYYFNPLYPDRGKSIYDGKIDFFDMLDEIWSQASQTNRVSTPVEYYDVDLCTRTKDGVPILPNKYNRQYTLKEGAVNGDGGREDQGIITTQPDLNFDKYVELANEVLHQILIGILAPSSFGFDVAKKDNAEAQREKEKQSIFTRNTIIDKETKMYVDLLNMALMIQDYLDTGSMVEKDYEITITYDEFANPSFESELQVLGPAWSQGQLSTKQFVRLLWGDKLSDEELVEEYNYLEENKQKDMFDLGGLNENGINRDLSEARPEQEVSDEVEE